jgi:hypothetical protein
MNKFLTCTVLAVALIYTPRAAGQPMQTKIKVQAMQMAEALVRNDYAGFIRFIPPDVVSYAGGKEKLLHNMDSASTAMKQFDIKFKKILIGNPGEIVDYKGHLQCVVTQTTTLESVLGDLEAETSLIAISPDQGENWYFVDTNVYKVDQVRSVLPGLSPALKIPPQKPPKVTPKTVQ